MKYRVIRTDESLEHAFSLFGKKKSSSGSGSGQQGAKKGSTWDKHKYIARQKAGDAWRYFYSQAELTAAKAKQTGQKAASAVKKGIFPVKRSHTDSNIGSTNTTNSKRKYSGMSVKAEKRGEGIGGGNVGDRDQSDPLQMLSQDAHKKQQPKENSFKKDWLKAGRDAFANANLGMKIKAASKAISLGTEIYKQVLKKYISNDKNIELHNKPGLGVTHETTYFVGGSVFTEKTESDLRPEKSSLLNKKVAAFIDEHDKLFSSIHINPVKKEDGTIGYSVDAKMGKIAQNVKKAAEFVKNNVDKIETKHKINKLNRKGMELYREISEINKKREKGIATPRELEKFEEARAKLTEINFQLGLLDKGGK